MKVISFIHHWPFGANIGLFGADIGLFETDIGLFGADIGLLGAVRVGGGTSGAWLHWFIHGKNEFCGGDGFFDKKKLAENLA